MHGIKAEGAFHEPLEAPSGFGLRQCSGAFGCLASNAKAPEHWRSPRRYRVIRRFMAPMHFKSERGLSMNRRGHREAACLGKAALKTHALQTLRDCRASSNRAKRLECVRFVGAFRPAAYWHLEATDVPFAPADFR
jgi:hypothetical protein